MRKSKYAIMSCLALACMVLLTACGGAPGAFNNPPDTAEKMKTELEKAGYTVDISSNTVNAYKIRGDVTKKEDFMKLENLDKKVTFEVMESKYFTGDNAEADAIAQKTTMDEQAAALKNKANELGVSFEVETHRSGSIFSTWIKASGKIKDIIAVLSA